ncbi:DnaQ family exonuclease/DinG family helicase [Paenibacillus curdlanolyticus YK9]|uniref:3'-5' exonuclease DinG n=1 Tax=Paenibacillus curdlanolyticus YK9 TaxID=717606 RepID=E0IC44_9BACL|nr:ATP-dependent DNA helicase DinG [Paenibacillus curdlanolyticus]EFM09730.1 DnaQ family exonuclease/DinG family helicase [Paenibacillus curdlanolyticus YK9]
MKFAVLDLETTGHQAEDEMIQIGIVMLDEELNVTDTFSSFVRPATDIPPFITQLTGITNEMVADAPSVEDVLTDVVKLLGDAVLVAHNVGFDAHFMNRALDRCGYSPFTGRRLDTIDLLRMLYPTLPSYQLGAVSEAFGITHERKHQADSDAEATAMLFAHCVHKLRDLPLLSLQRLGELFNGYDDLSWLIQLTLQNKEQSTSLDTQSHVYFNQLAMKAGDWADLGAVRTDEDIEALNAMNFEQFMSGVRDRFRAMMPDYEEREAQSIMFNEVHQALDHERHLLIEAGTGTGKSLGYLLPSLFYGAKEQKKIVVSTHTINLQEQLRQRDIPLLHEVSPFPFRAAVFKGRGNYICLRKFDNKVRMREYVSPNEDVMTAAQMIIWLGETGTGDQEELNFGNKGSEFWETVASDADSCLNRACPWFRRCFYHRAKHEANVADIVITNHSLVFTDIQAEHRLLPTYEQLVVDEAHHLEEVAGKHLGLQLSYFSFVHPFNRLVKDSRGGGLLSQLVALLHGESESGVPAWIEIIDEAGKSINSIREDWDKLFELMYMLIGTSGSQTSQIETGQSVFRIRPKEHPAGWATIADIENNVYADLNRAVRTLEKTLTDIKEKIDETVIVNLITDLNGAVKDLARVRDDMRTFIRADKSDTVYWIEATTQFKAKSIHLYAVPADVSEQLRTHLFEAKKSVILTSATLSVQKSFQYASEQLGLAGMEEAGRLTTVQLPSPFNYREQALVIIPRNFPTLKGAVTEQPFIDMLVQSLTDSAVEIGGRMLVLFTSYRMLRMVYEPLKEALELHQIQVLGQGIDSGNRSKLTRRFRQQPASVLLGTSSFWEGVDIPGDALTCLAIVRLPFQPPNHPLVEAKSELLLAQKQNPFMKLSIPQAVIRFKQGFGRLVRSTKDRGIVLIYDTRVLETYYGKYFLYSLPGPKIEHMHLEQIVPRMRGWLENGREGAKE